MSQFSRTDAEWSDDDATVVNSSTASSPRLESSAPNDQRHLIIFRGDSSTVFPLPAAGVVSIGRAETCELLLADPSISREHARITLMDAFAEVSDCGSQNGTKVNGERIVGSRPLISGDVITISNATLVFYSRVRSGPAVSLLEFSEFRSRTGVEIERALRFSRDLTMAAILLDDERLDRERTTIALRPQLRGSDLATWDGENRILVLFPETPPEEILPAAERLLEILKPISPDARVGYASAPRDGCDTDTLISSARAAARTADPHAIISAKAAARTIAIGDRLAIVSDPAMARLYQLIERLAATDLPVLILGETGTGKELAATALHRWSNRKTQSLVTLNCAAIPETLLESELFGYQKGAFTGAHDSKQGLFERGHKGTVFLDEVGDLPLGAQAKLLRVLEAKRFIRLGGLDEQEIDVRIIAATHRNLEDDVKTGRFRQDLYFRLEGGLLWIPPLRDRTRELSILAESFLADACQRTKVEPKALSPRGLQRLSTYAWPGNIRELKNLMEYLAATVLDPIIDVHHLVERIGSDDSAPVTVTHSKDGQASPRLRPIHDLMQEVERQHMINALDAARGNQTRAAELIQMPLRTFQAKVRKYAIRPAKD